MKKSNDKVVFVSMKNTSVVIIIVGVIVLATGALNLLSTKSSQTNDNEPVIERIEDASVSDTETVYKLPTFSLSLSERMTGVPGGVAHQIGIGVRVNKADLFKIEDLQKKIQRLVAKAIINNKGAFNKDVSSKIEKDVLELLNSSGVACNKVLFYEHKKTSAQ